jgi:DnaJ-class molecular chaperone
MTKAEIIISKNIELECLPSGKVFYELNGKDCRTSKFRSVMFFGNNGYTASTSQNAGFDSLFFKLVKKGFLDIPSDYDTCYKCGGSGNVGYIQDGGTCYKCNGYGYLQIKIVK